MKCLILIILFSFSSLAFAVKERDSIPGCNNTTLRIVKIDKSTGLTTIGEYNPQGESITYKVKCEVAEKLFKKTSLENDQHMADAGPGADGAR